MRDWLYDVTGAYAPDRTIHLPQWLSVQTFKGLCEHFGWPQPAQNDHRGLREATWLAEVDRDLTWLSDKDGRLAKDTIGRSIAYVFNNAARSGGQVFKDGVQTGGGPNIWLILVVLFAILNGMRMCGQAERNRATEKTWEILRSEGLLETSEWQYPRMEQPPATDEERRERIDALRDRLQMGEDGPDPESPSPQTQSDPES